MLHYTKLQSHNCSCFRYDSLQTTVTLLPHIVETLELMAYGGDTNKATKDSASTLYTAVTNFSFILGLTLSHLILKSTQDLCKTLQGTLAVRSQLHKV